MADNYKLTYFNARGAAETIRYILALAEVEYVDNRVERDEWQTLKPNTKWGVLPFIEINGEVLGQSLAIGRYLARKYNLAGETPIEEAHADELVDSLGDLRPHMRPIFMEQDEVKKGELKKEFVDNHAKPFLAKLVTVKEKNGGTWMVGKNVTWADIHLSNGFEFIKFCSPDVLNEFPALKELQHSVFSIPQIKKWIETRPKTIM